MIRRKGKVAASDNDGDLDEGIWSEKDGVVLERMLKPLRLPPKPDVFGMFGSEARGLVSCPKSEVYDRASAYLATINVTAALVLSAIAGMATSPMNVDNLTEDKKALGCAVNVLT